MHALKFYVVIGIAVGGLGASSPAAATTGGNGCPIDQMAGRVDSIQGPADRIVIRRGHDKIPARLGVCVLYGDKIDASRAAEVDIDTDDGTKRLGELTGVMGWDVPDPAKASDPSVVSVIEAFYKAITEPIPSRTVTGVARDASCPSEETNTDPLTALPAAPQGKQRIGADLTELVAPWSRSLQKRSVTVRLGRADGTTLVTVSACALSFVKLALPPDLLKPGDSLLLDVRDAGGSTLEWPIDVVAADTLPRPKGDVDVEWELAAWRLAEDGKDIGLDSITRLLAASNRSYAARQFVSSELLGGAAE